MFLLTSSAHAVLYNYFNYKICHSNICILTTWKLTLFCPFIFVLHHLPIFYPPVSIYFDIIYIFRTKLPKYTVESRESLSLAFRSDETLIASVHPHTSPLPIGHGTLLASPSSYRRESGLARGGETRRWVERTS